MAEKVKKTAGHNVIVIGHKNPDTDSICSAIAYAALKNKIDDSRRYEAYRAGDVNLETAYVLERFGFEVPKLIESAAPDVSDMSVKKIKGIPRDTSMREALKTMRERQAKALPITEDGNRLSGIISLGDIAIANMDGMEDGALAKAETPVRNLVETIDGTLFAGDMDAVIEKGRGVIGAASPDAIEEFVEEGDIVMVANRYESQFAAIEAGAGCLIICLGAKPADSIVKLAKEHGCILIATPLNTYKAATRSIQSMPVGAFMTDADSLVTFRSDTSADEVIKKMAEVRHTHFPVLSPSGKYRGMISRHSVMNLQKKSMILVDHNEKGQCVSGFEEAEVLEVIDHHRIGDFETAGPVYFRNQPVGCTATIIRSIYREHDVEIDKGIAGLLLSAIISDTLCFRSPTCTPLDRKTAEELAGIAGVDIDEYAENMFEAGEDLQGRTAQDIIFADFKEFEHEGVTFGVGQGSFMSPQNLEKAMEMVEGDIEDARRDSNTDMIFFLLTDIRSESSRLVFSGDGAAETVGEAFGKEAEQGVLLEDVVSRKKQFIPAVLGAIDRM